MKEATIRLQYARLITPPRSWKFLITWKRYGLKAHRTRLITAHITYITFCSDTNSTVVIVPELRSGWPTNRDSISGRGKKFYLLQNSKTASEAPPPRRLIQWTRGLFYREWSSRSLRQALTPIWHRDELMACTKIIFPFTFTYYSSQLHTVYR